MLFHLLGPFEAEANGFAIPELPLFIGLFEPNGSLFIGLFEPNGSLSIGLFEPNGSLTLNPTDEGAAAFWLLAKGFALLPVGPAITPV